MLTRIIDPLNVAIDHPAQRNFGIHPIEAGQEIASDLKDQLQNARLP